MYILYVFCFVIYVYIDGKCVVFTILFPILQLMRDNIY